jgi:Fic family protein
LNELLEIPVLYLSSNIIKSKARYYKLLNLTNRTNEWEQWILYILKIVELTADQTIGKIISIITLPDFTTEEVKSRVSKIYREELVEILFEHPYAKIEYLVQHLGIERKAASRYLRKLEEIIILESHKIGRETLYVNKGLMKILKE